jgi:hypothetical protein
MNLSEAVFGPFSVPRITFALAPLAKFVFFSKQPLTMFVPSLPMFLFPAFLSYGERRKRKYRAENHHAQFSTFRVFPFSVESSKEPKGVERLDRYTQQPKRTLATHCDLRFKVTLETCHRAS